MSNNTFLTEFETWRNLPRRTKWEDIKVGEYYHIPPYMRAQARDIKITSVLHQLVYFKEIGKTSPYNELYIYKDGIDAKVMVKHKIEATIEKLKAIEK